MPEIRKDPVLGHCIILASDRQKRPNDFAPKQGGSHNICPFCPGNEHNTPPEICRIDQTNKSDGNKEWKIRVVPNKYPALDGNAPLILEQDGIYEKTSAPGRHEVIIETPLHTGRLENLPLPHLTDIIRIYAMRSKAMLEIPFIKYAMTFKNQGRAAGASLEHPHSQIAGIPIPPKRVMEEIKACTEYKNKTGKCVFCDMVQEEMSLKKRLICQNDHFISFAPFASRTPFEINILPKKHLSRFEEITDDEASFLSKALKESLKRLSAIVPELCYNMMILTSPKPDSMPIEYDGIYHWRLEIMPKLAQAAGFEWGTGFYINTLSPENAAEILRVSLIC